MLVRPRGSALLDGRLKQVVTGVVIGTAAIAVTALLTGLGSVSAASSPAAGSTTTQKPKPLGSDPRAFPRTLSFWKCGPEGEVARRDLIVSFGFCNIDQLRRLNPRGTFLLTPGLYPRNGGSNYGGMNVSYGQGLWHWRDGYGRKDGGCDKEPGPVDLGCMRAFNFDWDYMWNADGKLATISNYPGAHRGYNLADPTGKGTRELIAKFFAYTAKVSGLYAKRWDGVFSDNWTYTAIGLDWTYGPNLDTDRDGKVDDIQTLRKLWNDGLNEIGNRIRSYLPNKTIGGNGSWYPAWLGYEGTDPQGWLKASNATFVEDITGFYDRPRMLVDIASRWLNFKDPDGLPRYVMFQQDALTGPNRSARLSIPAGADPNDPKYMLHPGVMRSMRWGLTISLVTGAYYEIIIDDKHATLWWYDEFDGGAGIRRRGYLGQPVGPLVQIRADGVWKRDFQNGIALNNSSPKPVTVILSKPFRRLKGAQNPRLNNGKRVTRVTIPAHDGLILLNVGKKKTK
jgi:Hypothetical glycosyl hydrolase family 15